MIVAPDEGYTAAQTGEVLDRSERQVLRYLTSGKLRGSKASGRWTITAVQIWEFQGIAAEMMANWRAYCRLVDSEEEAKEKQIHTEPGE